LEIATVNSEWTLGSGAVDDVEEKSVAPDETIVFRQLRERKGATGITDVIDEDDLAGARGSMVGQAAADGLLFAERLAKSKQMTGLADPVYVEAFLQVHSFDLVLELLVVNRTQEMLQNVLVELSTQGDLKIVDRPIAVTLEPGQQATVHASIKVGSTETGVIFGYVTHEKKSAADKECTVMNELHVDILDYIECASIGELAFHTMWSEFEWENKININTAITEVNTFLGHIMRNTNMSIVGRNVGKKATVVDKKAARKKKSKITEEDVEEMIRETEGVRELIESSSFVAVNLYAKSIFGEDALANVSIEKLPDGKLTGSVRIRSRTQGIALSLGDRVTVVQRGVGPSSKTR
jgi:coatomer subunit beta